MHDKDDILKFITNMNNPPTARASVQPYFLDASGNVTTAPDDAMLDDAGLAVMETMSDEELTSSTMERLNSIEQYAQRTMEELRAFDKKGKAKIISSDLYARLEALHETVEQLIADTPELLDSALYGNVTNAAINDLRKWLGE